MNAEVGYLDEWPVLEGYRPVAAVYVTVPADPLAYCHNTETHKHNLNGTNSLKIWMRQKPSH